MGILKRKIKKFEYKGRFYEGDNPYAMKQKFDEFRTTVGGKKNLKSKFNNALEDLKGPQNKSTNKTILIVIAILVLISLYIIDFDLSIFSIKK